MISDPWYAILTSLEPNYDRLKVMLEKGPQVYADLHQQKRTWVITLQQDPTFFEPSNISEIIEWATAELEKWKDVRRMSYDQWHFKRKRDAEKFQTLYHLRWTWE